MNILMLIYVVAAVFAVSATACAGVVIFLRVIRQRVEARTARLRAELLPDLIAALESGPVPGRLVEILRANPVVARDLFAELAEIIRGSSRDRLLRLARDCGLHDWLVGQLGSRRVEACRLAADVLRLFDDPDTVAALERTLDDPRAEVRLIAALALADLGRMPPLIEVVPRLVVGTDERSMLLRRVFAQVARRDVDEVMRVAAGDIGDAAIRPLAIEALGDVGGADVGRRLRAMAFDSDPEVRAAVLSALAARGDPSAADVIGSRLDDPSWQVRAAAIEATRRLALSGLVPALAERVDDDVWWVRFRAGEALAGLGEAGIRELRALAVAGGANARRMASIVMAERGIA